MGLLKLFTKNLYIKARVDSDEALKIKGTPIPALITSIESKSGIYIVYCSPEEGYNYSDRIFLSKPLRKTPSVRIGGTITVYVDEFDCDGQYFVDVPVKG